VLQGDVERFRYLNGGDEALIDPIINMLDRSLGQADCRPRIAHNLMDINNRWAFSTAEFRGLDASDRSVYHCRSQYWRTASRPGTLPPSCYFFGNRRRGVEGGQTASMSRGERLICVRSKS